MTPNDHTSALFVYSDPLSNYGAIYAGLPTKDVAVSSSLRYRLNPQSATWGYPFLNKMLAGFKSRWRIWFFSAKAHALIILVKIEIALDSVSGRRS